MGWRFFSVCVLSVLIAQTWSAALSWEVDTLVARQYQHLMATEGTVDSVSVHTWLLSQQANGSWTDINYKDTARNNWQPVNHINRLQAFAKLATIGRTTWNGFNLLDRIKLGFEFYISYRYSTLATCIDRVTLKSAAPPCPIFSANWFHNDIGEAIPYGKTLLLLRGILPDTTLVRWSNRMVPTLLNHWPAYTGQLTTGANLFWEGEGLIYKSAIQNNPTVIDSTMRLFRAEGNEVDSVDGILRDRAFNQHGVIYNGGYGTSFLASEADWLAIAEGLSFGWTAGDKQMLVDELIDGHAFTTFAGRYDAHVFGREIARNTTHGAGTAKTLANTWQAVSFSGYRQAELAEAYTYLGGGAWPWASKAAKIFWNSDYSTYHGAKFNIAWRTVSNRNIGTEQMNGENLRGWFLSYGVHWIHIRAMDPNIFPVMNWARLPGLTVDQVDTFPIFTQMPGGKQNNMGNTVYAGGASSGPTSAVGYDHAVSGITGKKSGFFVNGFAVFLGAGFNYSKTKKVGTTVDQQLLTGQVWMQRGTSVASAFTDSLSATDIQWLWHDTIGYWFPTPASMEVVVRSRTGSWQLTSTSASATPITKTVFSAMFDHGTAGTSKGFAYAVVPGLDRTAFTTWTHSAPFAIRKNTAQVQSIEVTSQNWLGSVFFSADSVTLADGTIYKASKGLTLIAIHNGASLQLAVADPTHLANSATIETNLHLSGAGVNWNATSQGSTIAVTFPTGRDAGRTVLLSLTDTQAPVNIKTTPQGLSGAGTTSHYDLLGRSPH
jgi:chondroitin AC lyase